MMKFIMFMIFMIPLNFKNFWLIQYLYFMLFFLFFVKFSFNYLYMELGFNMGWDLLSYMMILLSIWICSLMMMASFKLYSMKNNEIMFMFFILMLLFSLILTFSVMNLFYFYLFFEMSLIPTLMLIIGWGYQPERIQAGVYLLFYTLIGSMPMLVSIFFLFKNLMSLNFLFMEDMKNLYLYLGLNLVFLIKLPMFMVHLWLPKAHVEAPISGSMILAGVMLKLGGYGMMRLMLMFEYIGMKFNLIFIMISMIGGVIISLICLRQSDMKSLIAYSSVAHMGLVISGIMTMNYWGLCGSLVMMLAHGLCSSGLFCLANISYERLLSRSLYLNKGLINLMPSMSLWWFLLSSSNMAAPPSLNLLGEIMLMGSLVMWNYLMMLFLSLMSFFSAAYSLYLYSFSQHGKFYSGIYSFSMGFIREYLLLILHWLPLNLLILKSELLTLWI
uniref:NADH-ubiquinone oxidoreductase chain 4 n=1 Tax=Silvanus bidentatus TaxID=878982 RepID=A0A343A409_9CUCU|nr:NADH dehydrogenase subunit 4 [Silvanus bidentatus]AOY39287.1 NADH dehydrogenase subunit 4 [Silvanus bidentatus]